MESLLQGCAFLERQLNECRACMQADGLVSGMILLVYVDATGLNATEEWNGTAGWGASTAESSATEPSAEEKSSATAQEAVNGTSLEVVCYEVWVTLASGHTFGQGQAACPTGRRVHNRPPALTCLRSRCSCLQLTMASLQVASYEGALAAATDRTPTGCRCCLAGIPRRTTSR